jgi:transcriptional regulator with XRE-family HTH domain
MLKQAREAKGLSLADVADTTFISIRYLEAIEAGKTDILPQAYVRAFIREYAAVVGLDAAATMRLYDNRGSVHKASSPVATSGSASQAQAPLAQNDSHTESGRPTVAVSSAAPEARESLAPEIPAPPLPSSTQSAPAPRRDLTDMIQKAAVVMGVVVIAIVLWNVMGIEKPKTPEIPFQNVIKENEQHAGRPGRRDSTRATGVPQGANADSLTLQAQTTDSVWVQVIVDGGPPREYLFRPNARASWKAAEKFLVTVGNAGAVHFTLNKKDLGSPGKKGAVVQKLELTRETLTH